MLVIDEVSMLSGDTLQMADYVRRWKGLQGGRKMKQEPDKKRKLKRKDYEKKLHHLQVELCHLQDWAKSTGARIIIIFEGRDAAGKGGTIRAMTERVSPRVFRVVALPAPIGP